MRILRPPAFSPALAALAALLFLPAPASAARFEVDLVVTFSDLLPAGSGLTLTFDVDPDTPDSSTDPASSRFFSPGTVSAIGTVFPLQQILVRQRLWRARVDVTPGGFDEIGLNLSLDLGPVLTDIEQPLPFVTSPVRGQAVANVQFGVDLFFVNADVTALRFVPEPGRAALLAAALGLVRRVSRSRTR